MKINSILVRAIIKTFKITDYELSVYFKHDIPAYQSCLEINHEYMMDASILFTLLERLRAKHTDTEQFYALLYKLNVLHLGFIGNFLICCKNMYIVHDKLEKYEMLISDFVEFYYRIENEEIICGAQIPYSLVKAENDLKDIDCVIDFELISRHRILESIVRGKIKPKRIMLNEKVYKKERLPAIRKLFECEIYSHQGYNEIVYSLNNYTKSIEYNNYTSYLILEPHVDNHLKKLYNDENYHMVIKRLLMNNLHQFPLSIEVVAQRLLMSVRKLQKILQEENTSYQTICNDVKKEIALLYLSKGYKVKEIAQKLGYKESNSFTRSFRTWFDMSPDEYKEHLLAKKEKLSSNVYS